MSRHEHTVDVDPFDPAFIACPFPTYEALRERGPAVYLDHGKGFWLVSHHELVKEIVGNVATFSSESGPLGATVPSVAATVRMAAITPEGGMPGRVSTLLTLDPPAHTRNRRLISRAFTPAAVRRYEGLARQTCRDLIGSWRDGEVVDFVARFAVPLPVTVIAHALDVPDDRIEDFKRWSDASVAAIGADLTDDEMVEDFAELLELAGFVQEHIDRKRAAAPADDVLSNLVHATLSDDETEDLEDGALRQLTDNEIQSIVRQILVAGNETTTNLLTQLLVLLFDLPEWWERLYEDASLVPAVVEEGLRYASPSAVNQRATTCPVDFHGVEIPARDVVLLSYLGANHDPVAFPDPERFDPTRTNLGEHLAFGRGIHFCPGASLARMETRVALEELTGALAGYDIPDREHLAWNSSFQLRAMKSVPFVPRFRTSG